MQPLTQTCRSIALAGCGVLCLMSVATANEPLPQYFEGLRQRRMFTVAETEARRRLAQENISDSERAELTIELSKTYADHAMFSTGQQRRELWLRAGQIVSQLLQSDPDSPFRGLLQVQRAMIPAARGAQLRWQSELFPLDESTREDAAAILREALDRLQPLPETLQTDLKTVQTALRHSQNNAEQPAPARLHRLQREVEFAIAVAQLDLAKVLPQGADRVAAMLAADEQFKALTRSARPDHFAWQSRVHRLEILRLRSESDRLEGQIHSLLKSDPPPGIAAAAVAVLVRRWLDENRPDEALAVIEQHRSDYGLDGSDELQSLLVETLLTARRLAISKGDTTLADELLARAEGIDAQLQGPWKARSTLRLEQTRDEDRYGTELAGSVREAHWAWQNGNVDRAISAYTRAAAKAHQQGESDLAVEFGLNIASAQVQAERFPAAVTSLDNLLDAYPDHEKSHRADLLRAYALGRIFEQQPTGEHKQAYRKALQSHRKTFAGQPTFAEATSLLARLHDSEQDADGAIALLREIPAESDQYPAAIARLAAIFERTIEQARGREEPAQAWQQRAVEALAPIVAAFPPPPEPLTIEQAQVARRLARVLMYRSPPDFVEAETLLERVIRSGRPAVVVPEPDAAWTDEVASASQLQLIALAGQGRLAEARELLDRLGSDAPQQMLQILVGLSDVAAEIGLEHRAGIAQIQLQVAESLKTRQSELPEDQQRLLDLSLARAHAAAGRWQSAAKLYEEMLWKQPKDREVVAALARVYEECGTDSCLRQALKQWQTLESLQRKGSIDWLKSRYQLALCSHRLGEDETARKLIGVTGVLYPKLGTPALKARFETLAAELKPARQDRTP